MASALDRALNEYRSKPKDQSGVRSSKMSLIFDPKTAAFTDSDTFYQIGYQGYTELLSVYPKLKRFEDSVFDYSNSKIDPLFLTSDDHKPLSDKVRRVLFILSDYCMNLATVKILEYLIQQFAVNRLHPDDLLLITLPYLETSLFARIVQTIPFKSLRKEHKFLRPFSVIQESKQPIDRKQLIQWIIHWPVLLSWILGNAPNICSYHPNGVYAKFVGVLISELMLQTTNEVIITNIYNGAKQAIEDQNAYMVPQYLMAISTLIEKRSDIDQKFITSLTKAISKNSATFFAREPFKEMFESCVYLFQKSQPINVKPEFVIGIGNHVSEVKELIQNLDTSVIARSCANIVVSKVRNEDLVKSAIAILETNFFEPVAHDFLLNLLNNYPGKEFEYVEMLVQKIANDYPETLTEDVNKALADNEIQVVLQTHTRQSLVDQLSQSSHAAAIFAGKLDYKTACDQCVQSLKAQEASDSTDVILPLIKYFIAEKENDNTHNIPEDLVKYICEHLFLTGKEFSQTLNSALAEFGSQFLPFFANFPRTSSNKEILYYLIEKVKDLPDINCLPFAAARAISYHTTDDITKLLRYLPRTKIDYTVVSENVKQIYTNSLEFVSESKEIQAAFILAVIQTIVDKYDLEPESIISLFQFPDIRSILIIVSKLVSRGQLPQILTAYALTNEQQHHICRQNILTLIAILLPHSKLEEVFPVLALALLDKTLYSRSKDTIRSINMKDLSQGGKDVISHIIKQMQLFTGDEKTTKDVFINSSNNPKARPFYDEIWNAMPSAILGLEFYKLTHDSGVVSVISKFINDKYVVDLFTEVVKDNSDNDTFKLWAFNSLNSGLIRAVMPYLEGNMLSKCLPFACSYPQFYSTNFALFFKNQQIPIKDLQKELLKDSQSKIKEDKSEEPPEVFQYKNMTGLLKSLSSRNVISPSTVLLENLNAKADVSIIFDLVETLFELLKSKDSEKSLPLIFPLLYMCIKPKKDATKEDEEKMKKASQFMVNNFETIISSVSSTTIPHIHSTALSLIEQLARSDPQGISKHATSLFTNLSAETLYNDDQANLQKIKQLLSAILPILSKNNTIEPLLNFLSENIELFSMDRASQILLHSITCLGSDSYKIFQSLLQHDQVDFSLILADQMRPEPLMAAVTRLTDLSETSEQLLSFVKQLRLPALPAPVIRFFLVLQDKIDQNQFVEFLQETCDEWGIQDFLNFAETAISKTHLTKIIHEIIKKRVHDEPIELFSQLLEPLKTLIQHCKLAEELKDTAATITEIIPVLQQEQAQEVSSLVDIVIKTVQTISSSSKEESGVKILAKQQVLSMSASALDRFKFGIVEVFPSVLDYAADFLKLVVENQIDQLLNPTIGSFCLIINTSPDYTADKLTQILPLLLSPIILEEDTLRDLIMDTLSNLFTKLTIEQILPAFSITINAKENPHPLKLICAFNLLQKSLESSTVHVIRHFQVKLTKIFFLAFTNRFDDWDDTEAYQSQVKDAFVVFINRLNEQLFAIVFSNVLQFMLKLAEPSQPDYIIGRCFITRIILGIVESFKEVFSKYYSSFIDTFVQYAKESQDNVREEFEITTQTMRVIMYVAQYGEQTFLDDRFTLLLDAVKIHLDCYDGEPYNPEDLEDTFCYENKIINYVAPAFAALINASKSNTPQMMNILNEYMRSDKSIVRRGIFITISTIFEQARENFLSNCNSILPVLNEQLESADQEVAKEADQLIRKLMQIESVSRFFSDNQ